MSHKSKSQNSIVTIIIALSLLATTVFAYISAIYFYIGHVYIKYSETDSTKYDAGFLGTFGDAIGGLLNPLLSVFTFAGLLYTILVQREELSLQREELRISNQTLADTKEELAESRKTAQKQFEHLEKESRKSEISRALDLTDKGIDKMMSSTTYEGKAYWDIYRSWIADHVERYPGEPIDGVLGEVRFLIIQLNDALEMYNNIEDDSPVVTYYEMKYFELADCYAEYGLLENEDAKLLLRDETKQ